MALGDALTKELIPVIEQQKIQVQCREDYSAVGQLGQWWVDRLVVKTQPFRNIYRTLAGFARPLISGASADLILKKKKYVLAPKTVH